LAKLLQLFWMFSLGSLNKPRILNSIDGIIDAFCYIWEIK